MFRESEEDGDAFLNFAEYSQFHRGAAALKKDGAGKGGDDAVLSKDAWIKLTDSIPECDPEVGLSLDAFIQLKTIQQNMDLNKSYDEFFFAKYNDLNDIYKAKEAVAVETATIAANKTKASEARAKTLADQRERKQLDKSEQMAATLFGKFHDFKDLTDYRLSASQLAAILSAALGEEQTVGDAKWALYCSEVKVEELQPAEGAAPDAPKKYKGMTLAQFVAWCDSASASAAGLNRRKGIRKIFYTQADAALANAEDKNDILKPLIPAAKAARIDADTKRERREELDKALAAVTAEMNTQQQKREKLGELLERHSSATAQGKSASNKDSKPACDITNSHPPKLPPFARDHSRRDF